MVSMGCESHKQVAWIQDERGQASVEYLLVSIVLIAVIAGLGTLWRFFSDGKAFSFMRDGASHALTGLGGIVDVLMF